MDTLVKQKIQKYTFITIVIILYLIIFIILSKNIFIPIFDTFSFYFF